MKSVSQIIEENEGLIRKKASELNIGALSDWFLSYFLDDLDLDENIMEKVEFELQRFEVVLDAEKQFDYLSPNELIARYKQSFKRANGKDVNVTYLNGWFRLYSAGNPVKNFSRSKLCHAITVLDKRPEKKS